MKKILFIARDYRQPGVVEVIGDRQQKTVNITADALAAFGESSDSSENDRVSSFYSGVVKAGYEVEVAVGSHYGGYDLQTLSAVAPKDPVSFLYGLAWAREEVEFLRDKLNKVRKEKRSTVLALTADNYAKHKAYGELFLRKGTVIIDFGSCLKARLPEADISVQLPGEKEDAETWRGLLWKKLSCDNPPNKEKGMVAGLARGFENAGYTVRFHSADGPFPGGRNRINEVYYLIGLLWGYDEFEAFFRKIEYLGPITYAFMRDVGNYHRVFCERARSKPIELKTLPPYR